jgi:hypothetical protein
LCFANQHKHNIWNIFQVLLRYCSKIYQAMHLVYEEFVRWQFWMHHFWPYAPFFSISNIHHLNVFLTTDNECTKKHHKAWTQQQLDGLEHESSKSSIDDKGQTSSYGHQTHFYTMCIPPYESTNVL